ncbi:retrotransposon protein, putative, ty1-copia subclass [Tanacetum coccineum]
MPFDRLHKDEFEPLESAAVDLEETCAVYIASNRQSCCILIREESGRACFWEDLREICAIFKEKKKSGRGMLLEDLGKVGKDDGKEETHVLYLRYTTTRGNVPVTFAVAACFGVSNGTSVTANEMWCKMAQVIDGHFTVYGWVANPCCSPYSRLHPSCEMVPAIAAFCSSGAPALQFIGDMISICNYWHEYAANENVHPQQNSILMFILEKDKLSRPNFLDRYRNLRIFLQAEKKLAFLESPIPAIPVHVPPSTKVALDAIDLHTRLIDTPFFPSPQLFYLPSLSSLGFQIINVAPDPAVMAIRGGKIVKKIKKLHAARGKGQVGNGHRATIEAIGSFDLCLPNGLVIVLDNCHYAPSITRGVIRVSRLNDNGFVNCFMNGGISYSKDNFIYFHAIPRDGIYEIDLHCYNSNNTFIYSISNKRAKLKLDSTLLWHCRLGHINKKRIEKLQHDRLLKSTNDESFDKCVSCMSGKMARKPFAHQTERAKDLLGLIQTNVCDLFKTVSRQELATLSPLMTTLVIVVIFTCLNINMQSLKLLKFFKGN